MIKNLDLKGQEIMHHRQYRPQETYEINKI